MEADFASLSISMPNRHIPAGESVFIDVLLRNETEIERPFYGITPDDHTLEFELASEGESTRIVNYNDALLRQGADPEVHAHPVEMPVKSGATLEHTYQLCQMSGFLPEGAYSIRVLYEGGYLISDTLSFEIVTPRQIDDITSVWDHGATALSHVVSLARTPNVEGDGTSLWMEEHESRHTFSYTKHLLTSIQGEGQPILAHTRSYLSNFRHIVFQHENETVRCVLVENGKVSKELGGITPPTTGARILKTLYTSSDNDLILFAALDQQSGRSLLWMGRLQQDRRLEWRQILNIEIERPAGGHAPFASNVSVGFDYENSLHVLLVVEGVGSIHYFKWDEELVPQFEYRSVFARRAYRDGFLWYDWDFEQSPPRLTTGLGILFEREAGVMEQWNCTPENVDNQNDFVVVASTGCPSGFEVVHSQLDKNSRVHVVLRRVMRHYYVRVGHPLIVNIDHTTDQLFPSVLLNYDPLNEHTAASIRYRMPSGQYRFLELVDPPVPRLQLSSHYLAIGKEDTIELKLGIINAASQAILVPNLADRTDELVLVLESIVGDYPSRTYHQQESEPRDSVNMREVDQGLSPIRSNRFSIRGDVQGAWTEIGPEDRLEFSLELRLVAPDGDYRIHAVWNTFDTVSDSVPLIIG